MSVHLPNIHRDSDASYNRCICRVVHHGPVNGLELFLLGTKLMGIGQEAMPRSGFHALSASARAVLVDVFQHPGSSIKEITERTGHPQSLVSSSVARFRDQDIMVTEPDPADGRRTLVRPAPGKRELGQRIAGATTVDTVLAEALGAAPEEVAGVVAALEFLARRLAVMAPADDATPEGSDL
jgi:DNA-binding MarR family transcriptional regulator